MAPRLSSEFDAATQFELREAPQIPQLLLVLLPTERRKHPREIVDGSDGRPDASPERLTCRRAAEVLVAPRSLRLPNDQTVRGTNFTCFHAGPKEVWAQFRLEPPKAPVPI